MTQQSPASPDQPTQQDQPSEPVQPQGGETGLASQPQLPDQPPAAPPPPPPAPTAPPKKRRVGLIVILAVLGALAVAAVGIVLLLNTVQEELPQVGDCMTDASNPDDMEVVACDADGAAWSVAGSDGTWTRGDFDAASEGEVCQNFPDTQQALWVTNATSVEAGTEGEVICLVPIGAGG